MECEKIMELFHSELVTVNVGPRLFATALEQQGYRTVQVDWRPAAVTLQAIPHLGSVR